jgi:T-complex protein 1 subunit beta
MAKVAEIEKAERERMLAKVDRIIAYGCNVFINRQLIYNLPEQHFAAHGIMAIEHADFDGIERLAAVTGGEIIATFDTPGAVKLGSCKLIEEVMIGEERVIRFSGTQAGEACSVILRGSSSHILEEAERSLHDALCVLSETMKETRIVFGGGCSETLMAKVVDELAQRTPGKKALAMEAFARALRQIPTIICDNAGFDAAELTSQLRAAHAAGDKLAGIDVRTGIVGNMIDLGITESFKVKQQVLLSASEAAEMILRCDEIIQQPPSPRTRDPRMRGH